MATWRRRGWSVGGMVGDEVVAGHGRWEQHVKDAGVDHKSSMEAAKRSVGGVVGGKVTARGTGSGNSWRRGRRMDRKERGRGRKGAASAGQRSWGGVGWVRGEGGADRVS